MRLILASTTFDFKRLSPAIRFGLIALVVVALTLTSHAVEAAPMSAYQAPSCQALLSVHSTIIPEYKSGRVSAERFTSSFRNAFRLWKTRNDLLEIDDVVVREQCYGTCYLYAAQTTFESYLRATKRIETGDYLINVLPMLTIAWERYHTTRKQLDLEAIVKGGTYQGFVATTDGGAYVLDRRLVEKVGGPGAIDEIESDLINDLEKTSWWKRSETSPLKENLEMELPAFLARMQSQIEERLTKRAKRPVRLHRIDVGDYESRTFLQLSAGDPEKPKAYYVTSQRKFKDLDWMSAWKMITDDLESGKAPAPERSEDQGWTYVTFRNNIFETVLDSLKRGIAPKVSFARLFSAKGAHAVAVVGAIIDRKTGELKGFKYVNSWGTDPLAHGFGYITIDQFRTHFQSLTTIQPKAETPN